MKKPVLLLFSFIIFINSAFAETVTFSCDGKFGLKDGEAVVVQPKYKKLVKLGDTAWIMQDKNRFGIIRNDGKILVEPKYTNAERVVSRFVKLGKGNKYGMFDEMGFDILPVEFSSIDLLYGGMFLTCKNYKYGITDYNGQVILENIFDDIYMPKPNIMVLEYNGQKYQIEGKGVNKEELTLPFDYSKMVDNDNFKITEIVSNPVTATGYYSVSATDYLLKIFSSISPAYENTIDELMFSKGADAAPVIIKFTWLPKFPFVYAKNYYQTLIAPNNGPLNNVKKTLKKGLKE